MGAYVVVIQWFRESSHEATLATDKLYLAYADKYLGQLARSKRHTDSRVAGTGRLV